MRRGLSRVLPGNCVHPEVTRALPVSYPEPRPLPWGLPGLGDLACCSRPWGGADLLGS